MANKKNSFKPTILKIILTIILFLIYFYLTHINITCPAVIKICVVSENTPGAIPFPTGEGYYVHAKSIPFSCAQTCTNIPGIILFISIIPILIIYLALSLIQLIFRKIKR
ncbi:hypothetical protein J4411_01180 [Candidatus Pacearchaeota archaeon]|nr:hypothetical protein [uncultured archaeon]MBS3084507.1 hypothetical protein [Candidatus Pacearchaeota archaeon]